MENYNYRLEKEYQQPYDDWVADKKPQSLSVLLKQMDPVIDKAISSTTGHTNSILKSKAKTILVNKMDGYDPNKSALNTYVYNQLKSLHRYNAQLTEGAHLPEKRKLNWGFVKRTRAEMEEELGREPSLQELADKTGYSEKRLKMLSEQNLPIAFSSYITLDDENSGDPAVQQGYRTQWADLVYMDLDPIDQKIMEYSLGYGGSPKKSTEEIARLLKRSPGAISQRRKGIQEKLNMEIESNLL